MICKFCNKYQKSKYSLRAHQPRCPENPNRTVSTKWTEAQKLEWSVKCKETSCNNTSEWTPAQRKAQSEMTTLRNNVYWTDDTRKQHSIIMSKVVEHNPDSYSKNNVSGRVKLFEVTDGFGNLTKVKGSWEYNVANWLNSHLVKWTNNIDPISYFWNGKKHRYFPDFYITEFDYYIEVKGFETDRDHCKWDAMIKPLMIIREKEHRDLDNVLNIFTNIADVTELA